MYRDHQEAGRYRVLLIRVGDNEEEEKQVFCKNLSENYGIPFPLLRKIVDRCPIVIKKQLPLKRAKTLAKTLRSFGATVSIEGMEDSAAILLEFQEMAPHRVALEASHLRRTQSGAWNVIGRIRNISEESLNDLWVLIQLFDDLGEFLTFEETPLPINPLPPGEASPFRLFFDGDLSIQRVSIAFKNSTGSPLAAADRRIERDRVKGREENEEKLQFIDIDQSSGTISPERYPDVQSEERPLGEIDVSSVSVEGDRQIEGEGEEPHLEETHLLGFEETPLGRISETQANREEILLTGLEEFKGDKGEIILDQESPQAPAAPVLPLLKEEQVLEEIKGDKGEIILDQESLQAPAAPVLPLLKEEQVLEEIKGDKGEIVLDEESSQTPAAPVLPLLEEEQVEGETVLSESEYDHTGHLNGVKEALSSVPGSEAALQLKEESFGTTEEKEKEGLHLFPWVEDFRKSVENYYEKNRNIFSIWFEMQEKEGEFTNSLHSLLTILVHTRFDQMCQAEKALENTQRVFRKILQPNLLLEEIPALEGTNFFSGENWRDLFYRALPKIQQGAAKILERERWDASDLIRFIQVIPHMGDKNSRMAARWIGELIPHLVEIDFSNTPVSIGQSLYRVASRLGVVDPHYDHYQGRNSGGDLKIQMFAKGAFAQFPMKIEEPMSRVGMKEEEGGQCFPTEPRCEGCLFEAFCPKLYLHFDPSGKGMRER